MPLLSLSIYVPRDERFDHTKFEDFVGNGLKAIGQFLASELRSVFDKTPTEFDTFDDVLNLYEGGHKLPMSTTNRIQDRIPWEMLKALVHKESKGFLRLPMPDVIKGMVCYFIV